MLSSTTFVNKSDLIPTTIPDPKGKPPNKWQDKIIYNAEAGTYKAHTRHTRHQISFRYLQLSLLADKLL